MKKAFILPITVKGGVMLCIASPNVTNFLGVVPSVNDAVLKAYENSNFDGYDVEILPLDQYEVDEFNGAWYIKVGKNTFYVTPYWEDEKEFAIEVVTDQGESELYRPAYYSSNETYGSYVENVNDFIALLSDN